MLNILDIGLIENLLIAFALLIVVTAISFFVTLQVFKKKKKYKMYSDIEYVLNQYVKQNKEANSLEKVFAPEYDYILVTPTSKTYIMIVPDFQRGEICINAPTKWQYRKAFDDEAIRFVPRVDKLMRFDPPVEPGKTNKRIYIIYPSTKSLLRYINECEMEFVRPTTDVNGTNVVIYSELLEHKDIIEL